MSDDWPAVAQLRSIVETGALFVVMSGSTGVGKSIAAALWLRRMHDKHGGCGMRWMHAHEVARISGYGEQDAQKAMETVNYFVLDDLGCEYLDAKGFMASTLDSLIYQRHGNRRPTVCTTNLTAAEFRDRYGPRILDRVREIGAFVQVTGTSRRATWTPTPLNAESKRPTSGTVLPRDLEERADA